MIFLLDYTRYLVANAYNLPIPTDQASQPEHVTDDTLPTQDEVDNQPEEMETEFHLEPGKDQEQDLREACQMFDDLLADPSISDEVTFSEALAKVAGKLEEKRNSMSGLRTAQLWLQYLDMVAILKKFIKAERTGNWTLHLAAVQDMLPYFAAAGHNLMPSLQTCTCKRCHNFLLPIQMSMQTS